jgi:hypothetical protein
LSPRALPASVILLKLRSGEKAREYFDWRLDPINNHLEVAQVLLVRSSLLTIVEMMGFSEQQLLRADPHSSEIVRNILINIRSLN